jgi:hypothetical protein
MAGFDRTIKRPRIQRTKEDVRHLMSNGCRARRTKHGDCRVVDHDCDIIIASSVVFAWKTPSSNSKPDDGPQYKSILVYG